MTTHVSEYHRLVRAALTEHAPDLIPGFEDLSNPVGPVLAAWLHKWVSWKINWLSVDQYEFRHLLPAALAARADERRRHGLGLSPEGRAALEEFVRRDMGPLPGGLRP